MKSRRVVAVFLSLVVLLVACAPTGVIPTPAMAPQAAAPAPATAAVAPQAPAKAAWEVEWEKTLEAAKKEGKVLVMTVAGPVAGRELSQGFSKAYGITLEVITATAAELVSKIRAERRAGLYFWDANINGSSTLVNDFKAAGFTDPLEPLLILPDLTQPDVISRIWYGGKLAWVDRDRHLLMGLLYTEGPIAINTEVVKRGEVESYQDLLNPKWKGKMIFNDPTVPGFSGSTFMPMIVLGGVAGGADWLRQVLKNEPIVIRDQRLMVDWLAHGKIAIVIAPKPDTIIEFMRAGAPIANVLPKEGVTLSGAASVMAAMNKRPHPNAAKVFINWYFSQEGQTAFSRGYGGQSARLDVPTDFLPPERLRPSAPGMNYYFKDDEEKLRRADEVFKIAKELFGPFIK